MIMRFVRRFCARVVRVEAEAFIGDRRDELMLIIFCPNRERKDGRNAIVVRVLFAQAGWVWFECF